MGVEVAEGRHWRIASGKPHGGGEAPLGGVEGMSVSGSIGG